MSVSERIDVREHTTDDIDFQLLSGGSAIDLTDVSYVQMEMRDKNRRVFSYKSTDTSPAVSIQDATSGRVRFTPPNSRIFLATGNPYRGYWRVWETASKNYSVPEDSEFEIYVREEY